MYHLIKGQGRSSVSMLRAGFAVPGKLKFLLSNSGVQPCVNTSVQEKLIKAAGKPLPV